MCLICVEEFWEKEKANLSEKNFFKNLPENNYALLYGSGDFIIFGENPIKTYTEIPENIVFKRNGELPPVFPDFVGFAGYEFSYNFDNLLPPASDSDLPSLIFFLFEQTSVYQKSSKTLYKAIRKADKFTAKKGKILERNKSSHFEAKFKASTDNKKTYSEKVAYIKEEIKKGNVYQVNLTRQEVWEYRGDIEVFAQKLFYENPASFSALIKFSADNKNFAVVSSSPERFFKIKNNIIISEPIKGTVKRGKSEKEDIQLRNFLLKSEKNLSELAMITDLIRNDLTAICKCPSVEVEKFPALMTLPNVHHLFSVIRGKLKTRNLEKIFKSLFPGGSITGCPKLSAMNYIHKLEEKPRNVYTGTIGWFSFDLAQADFNIAIRTAYAYGNTLSFGVGGGIVIDSNEEEEYLETVHKGLSIRNCLENA